MVKFLVFFFFFLKVELEFTPGTSEVAEAQARAVGLKKVSASILFQRGRFQGHVI